MKTLMASELPVPGTNFSAWVHRIMINHFISSVRNRREYNDLDQMPELGIPAAQHDRTELRELSLAFQRLPKDQQEALHLIGIEERSYEEASPGVTGCAIGTLEEPGSSGPLQLRSEMFGEIRAAA